MRSGRLTKKKSAKNAVSFRGLKAASEAASRSKRANLKRNSRHEILLCRELIRLGLRYRRYPNDLLGNPDIVFRKAKLVIFCDGDFWHGRNWPRLRRSLSRRHNAAYWIAKITSNRQRDKDVAKRLANDGWHVVRIWETDILRDPVAIACSIEALVNLRLSEQVGSHGSGQGTAARKRLLA